MAENASFEGSFANFGPLCLHSHLSFCMKVIWPRFPLSSLHSAYKGLLGLKIVWI